MKVVDVSTWQGKINWDEAKKHVMALLSAVDSVMISEARTMNNS